jgi:hypothetical protein
MYDLIHKFYGGYERNKTLFELGCEISSTNPKVTVEVISQKKGRVWRGRGADITSSSISRYYLNKCVQGIEENESGITLIV